MQVSVRRNGLRLFIVKSNEVAYILGWQTSDHSPTNTQLRFNSQDGISYLLQIYEPLFLITM